MPMVPEAAIAMLACARIGAVHSVVFGGFAANELATRIDDAKPKVILSASCGLEPGRIVKYKPLLDEASHLANAVRMFSWKLTGGLAGALMLSVIGLPTASAGSCTYSMSGFSTRTK
jgi:acyl-coenzyme A synthetase/AMP-(fatty) acid ligase